MSKGVCILSAWQAIPLGGLAIHRRIEVELMESAKVSGQTPGDFTLGEILSGAAQASAGCPVPARRGQDPHHSGIRKVCAFASHARHGSL
ncbi:hypothetical protein IscW_ISCW013227 [Ixodes scapularis]|uniref:Uncharacterized protein n=1 Tax=Ixodes scapularis TaxID=6945 RepID=B7QAD5_IXOSC|nr:hypothetical protein IscW_ISCW013227 [Ixodes scapularis]|eukprot:XP_002400523.1 hypothetical protein IscW_ISCW013227 [Ixodes scapularis]